MLNPNAQAWVDALRSGRFTQGQSALHRAWNSKQPDEFCCLGVACRLAKEAGVELTETTYRENADMRVWYGSKTTPKEISASYLPFVVQQWLGLKTDHGGYNLSPTLAFQNDHGASFDEIAAIIESKPDGLFTKEGD